MRIANPGRAVFAATLIAIGILGLIKGDFAPIWQPVPKSFPAREALAYLCALISLACGAGMLWQRTSIAAARVLLAYLAIWLLAFKARFIVSAPATAVSYETCGETAVLVAAAWVATGEGVRIARVVYGLAMIAFGVAHFAYLKLTAGLVPGWLPFHERGHAALALHTSRPAQRSSPGCMRGSPPHSLRCRSACSRCWCGYPWSRQAPTPRNGASSSFRGR